MDAYFHGEVVITRGVSIPKGAKLLKPKNGKYILADSETTGNHHCLEEKEGVCLYEKDGVLYMKNDVPVNVFCVIEGRHDTETLKPGTWEIDRANEFDYIAQEVRKVAD